jgi:hypothetical protein
MPENAELGALPGASLDLPSPQGVASPTVEPSDQETKTETAIPVTDAAPGASNVVRQLDSQLSRSIN